MQLEGLYTPVITPFTDSHAVDWHQFDAVLEFQLQHDIAGVIIGGSTGEFFALERADRERQFAVAGRRLGNKAAFIAGVNALQYDDCLALARAAADSGADALLVAAPPYILPNAAELAAHISRIGEAANLPVILYNYPARTGVDLDPAVLDRLRDDPRVVAIKESAGSVDRIDELVANYGHLQLSAGAEDLVLEFFRRGARSWVCVLANFMPAEAQALYRHCVVEQNWPVGEALLAAVLPVLQALEHGGTFIQSVKAACEACGRPAGPARLPLLPLSDAERAAIERLVGEARAEVAKILAA